MNELDSRIQAALQAATDLQGPVPEPTITEEILGTFQGRQSWLMILGAIKTIAAGALFYFCIYQFFLQESTMAMLAYGFAAVMCVVIYGCIFLFFWIQMKHNTTARELKRVELQLALLSQQLQQKEA